MLVADSAAGKSSFAEALFQNSCFVIVEEAENLDFKNYDRDPPSIDSYALWITEKRSLKSWIKGQKKIFFGNSLPGFEPMTPKSLLKTTCAVTHPSTD